MDPHDEEVIVNTASRGWAMVPGVLKLLIDPPTILRRVPIEALDYTVREVRDVLLRAYREGRI